jgi:hypothetical protein
MREKERQIDRQTDKQREGRKISMIKGKGGVENAEPFSKARVPTVSRYEVAKSDVGTGLHHRNRSSLN